MSMTCHFIDGRARRFLRIISMMTGLEKSMLVMSWQPWSYLGGHRGFCKGQRVQGLGREVGHTRLHSAVTQHSCNQLESVCNVCD